MLLFTGILLVFLIGFALVNCVSVRFSLMEKLGLSVPLGFAAETVLMTLLDLFGIPLTPTPVLLAGLIVLLGLCTLLYRKKEQLIGDAKTTFSSFSWKDYNLVWLFFIAMIVYVEYMNFSKTMYFPAFERDALAGFDTMGFVFAQEHTIKGASIFSNEYATNINGPGSYITYAPFVQVAYAYVYLLGAETSKLVPALMFLFFLVAFYGATSRFAGKTGAAIATLFMTLTPEMIAFSSMSVTNVMHAVYASLAVIYMSLWFRERAMKDLLMCGILLGANVWVRTEGVVFIGAVLILLFVDSIRRKEYKTLIAVSVLAFVPLLFWTLYLKINNMHSESIAITRLFWDAEKMTTIWNAMWGLVKNTTYYGWSFYVLLIAFFTNLWFIIKKRDNLNLLIALLLSFAFYIIVLYQINYIWDKMGNVLAYSAKRFLFCFIPIIWYYAFTNEATRFVTQKLERFLGFRKG